MAEVNEKPLPLTDWIINQPNVKKRNWIEMNELILEKENYPAIFSVTHVDLVKDQVEVNYKPRNALDNENYKLYVSAETYVNAPIGLQVISRRFNDEKVMKCVEIIEQAMGREQLAKKKT
ncbi:unnamed protein product [Rotaria sordida]|nr:unnamed protein product [Rotaria sordida]